jgi:peptidoglycan/LPS O-acetylase OafA/YrhL
MSGIGTPVARFLLVVGAVLVALAEIPRVVEADRLEWVVPLDALVRSSAVGAALILASVGYLAARALLRAREHGRLAPVLSALAVLAPIWVLQVLVLAAVEVARRLDTHAPPTGVTAEHWGAVLTFRWNLWITDHMLEVPGELVGLTFLSIAAQLLAVLTVAVVLLPRRWNVRVIAVLALTGAVAVVLLRARAAGFQDPFVLSMDTFARSDAFLLGVAAGCANELGRRLGPAASSGAVVALMGTVLASAFVSAEQHLVVHLPVVAMLAGIALLDDGTRTGDWLLEGVTRSREVAYLAASWAALVACATPAAVTIGRRTEMHWMLRVLVLVITVAVLVRAASAVTSRVRIPERVPSLGELHQSWRRVVAEADARVRADSASGRPEVRDEDRGPRREEPPGP